MKIFLFLLMAMIVLMPSFAQKTKGSGTSSYNFQRALEAIQEDEIEKGLEYLDKELNDNPKNGFAYGLLAMVKNQQEEYGAALGAADKALKYLPRKEKKHVYLTYNTRAQIYCALEDTIKALADYATAIKISPEEEAAYEARAQIYYEQKKYDLADADYRKIIANNQGVVLGYMGIGRNRSAQNKWDEAIEQFSYVVKLESGYSSAYSFRAEAYIQKEKWSEATDDIITALSLDADDEKAFYLMLGLKEPALGMIKAKMKIQSIKNPNNEYWPYFLAYLHEYNEEYDKAISYYEESHRKAADDKVLRRIAQCYYELGDFNNSLKYIDQAIQLDSTELEYLPFRADLYYEMGNTKEAIAGWSEFLRLNPESAIGYSKRGLIRFLSGDEDEALEDLTLSITLNPKYSYSYIFRGDLYAKQGKTDLAKADYERVLEIEDAPEKYACLFYAYQGLGENEKAIAALDTIIARSEEKKGNYYNAACLYSRLKNKEKALEYLEKSFQLGYNHFAHVRKDYDLRFLRETKEFKELLEKYEALKKAKFDKAAGAHLVGEEVTSEVPFTKENGVSNVKCNINGLPLYFVFDTGAATVSLSMVEATFMMKNGYLDKKDVVGSQYFQDANGNVSEGTVINIRQVDFGGMKLENVRASVVRNQKAPLLLGQSVLARLGKIEIDNSKHLLKITHTK